MKRLLWVLPVVACSTSGSIDLVTGAGTTAGTAAASSGTGQTSSSSATTETSASTGTTTHGATTHGATTGASSTTGAASTSGVAITGTTSGTSGSGTATSSAGSTSSSTTSGFVPVPAFYVATTGDDSDPGTLAKPFLTLGAAQTAMRASTTQKTTYIRAGTYKPPSAGGSCVWGQPAGSIVGLTNADSGETWSYYPPDGLGTAILDGQSTLGNSAGDGGNGVGCGFGCSHATNVTIVGLQFQRFLYSAFWGWAVDGLTFTDNEVHDTTSAIFAGGAVVLIASPGATISHNYLHDLAYMGTVVSDNSTDGGHMSDSTVADNVIENACSFPAVSGAGNDQNGGDCGAIYFWSQVTTISTNLSVTGNDVRDVNTPSDGTGDFGRCCAQGVYLDDGTNNVAVTGNTISGVTSSCFMIHGGQSNVFRGNLCDLGPLPGTAIVTYQTDGFSQMTGNVFEHNLVVAGSDGGGAGFWGVGSPPNPMTISDNDYFNYSGTALVTTDEGSGAGSDSNPTQVDPGVSCWGPTLGVGSPVLSAPVSFPGLPSSWGPPGFAIPQAGTPPSWPHGC